jgi:hypothetical protein
VAEPIVGHQEGRSDESLNIIERKALVTPGLLVAGKSGYIKVSEWSEPGYWSMNFSIRPNGGKMDSAPWQGEPIPRERPLMLHAKQNDNH